MTEHDRSRRRFINALIAAGVGGLAGCSSDWGSGESATQPTETPEPQTSTPTAPEQALDYLQERGLEFERAANLVDDLGIDPNGKDPLGEALETIEDGTLLLVPGGEYDIPEVIELNARSSIGLLGVDEVTLVPPAGYNAFLFSIWDTDQVYVSNFTIDQRRPETAAGLRVIARDEFVLEDIEFRGRAHRSTDSVENMLNAAILNPDGKGVLRNVVAKRNNWAHYGAAAGRMAIWAGNQHEGVIEVVDCDFREFGNNALYTSRCPGDIRVRNCYFENNNAASVRIGGEGSFVENSVFTIDPAQYDGPRDREDDDFSMRGVVIEENFSQMDEEKPAGAEVRSCSFWFEQNPTQGSAIEVYSNGRSLNVMDSKIVYNNDGPVAAIERHDYDERGGSNNPPGSPPRWLRITNSTITGVGDVEYAVQVLDGNRSRISDSKLVMSGPNVGGVEFARSKNSEIKDSCINVTGRQIVARQCRPTRTAIDNDCSVDD
jgi:hypothetical protein